jgi:pimeloyl-ACP methyl ester carboxylesterase
MPTVDSQGLSIHYEESGSGPPIILGHSFLCSGDMWAPQLPALSERFRVINVDCRGHGRSSRVERRCTLYDLVADQLAVLDHLGIERAVWAGLSIGGMVALRAALTARERVAALILLDTHAGSERLPKRLKYRLMALAVSAFGTRPLLPPIVSLMFGKTTLASKRDLVAEWKERFAAVDVASTLRVLTALSTRDSVVDRLGEIQVPALVIVGSEDRSLPPPCSRQIVAGLPAAELLEVAGAGHLSTLEQPQEVTGAMLDFLLSLSAATPFSEGTSTS